MDFYDGNTLIGTATTSPYHVHLEPTSRPARYSLTAVATDNGNATTTSGAVSITVNPPAIHAAPAAGATRDVGATGAAGRCVTSRAATFTVTGAGADVWGTADAFHYAYRR